jgi:pimeloyl-ACP methyl ester carboxylesterase
MTTQQITVESGGYQVPVTFQDEGDAGGRPHLLLHGGAGPRSVVGFAQRLAAGGARLIVPTHPGFELTPRPEALADVAALAAVYCALLEALPVDDVVVIGNSIGGWIAAEMALTAPARIGALVVVDAVGIEVPGHPVVDFFSLGFPEIAKLSYYDAERFRIDPAALPPEAQAAMAGNRAALAAYAGGAAMADPSLRPRLAGITTPTLVVWGDSDGIAGPEYGREFAGAIPSARYEVLPDTGHLPQLESPDALMDVLTAFLGAGHSAAAAN